MSLFIHNNNGTVNHIENSTVTINNNPAQTATIIRQRETQVEDVRPVDSSFFCTQQFAQDIIEKNIRQAIHLASNKADACRRIMALETYGYIVLSNVNDARKAELINPFAIPKFTFTQDDFINARRRKK